MKKYLKEILLLAIVALPYFYLASIWNSMPDKVPTHFNIDGIADDWSGKTTLLYIPCGLGILIYLLMLVVPYIDPKKQLLHMGEKYFILRFILVLFTSFLSIYLLYITNEGSLKNPNILFALIGILFAVMGNYFQTVRPNYFVGIRTPWALENEEVWKKTHRFGGRFWMLGGTLIAALAFLKLEPRVFTIIFILIICIISIVPVAFSYIEYKKQKNSTN